MPSGKLLLSVAAGCGIGVYYALRVPYPENFPPEDVLKIRVLTAQSKLYSWLASIGSLLRLGNQIEFLRALYRFGIKSSSNSDSEIFSEHISIGEVNLLIYGKLQWISAEDGVEEPRRPCVVYFHGGGWVFTSAQDRDAHVRHLVKELNVIVIAVDYRKAPEHPFPAALNDCVSATKYVYENCETLGIDRSRISVCGDSAGGNLAAAVALKLRDEGLRFLKNQVLIYPSVQFVNFRLNSFMTDHPLLSRADGVWCALMYAGENLNLLEAVMENEHVNEEFFNNPGFQILQKMESNDPTPRKVLIRQEDLSRFREKVKNPYLCPLMARSLKGLPTALIVLCQFDVLYDDGIAYGERLSVDGVDVTTVKIPGYHGAFRDFQFTASGDAIMRNTVKWLKQHL